jgi:hypothetical protein
MKRQLEAYLLQQLANPLPAVFVDSPRTGAVRKSLEYAGKTYKGSADIHEYKVGKYTLQAYAPQFIQGFKPSMITAPSSLMKQWQAKGWVLVQGSDYESSVWDVYDIDGMRGYRPWERTHQVDAYTGQLPASEFDNLWLPITRFSPITGWTPLAYFPFWIYQRAPIKGQQTGYDKVVIDLASVQQRAHEKLVMSVY